MSTIFSPRFTTSSISREVTGMFRGIAPVVPSKGEGEDQNLNDHNLLPRLREEEDSRRRLVYRLVNRLTHRERRCAAPARRATEDGGGHSWVIRRENQECPPRCKKRNEAGADAAALECQGICETVH